MWMALPYPPAALNSSGFFLCSSAPIASEEQAQLRLVGPVERIVEETAAGEDGGTVGKCSQLVEIGGDKEDGRAARPRLQELRVDKAGGGDVQSARGVDRHDPFRLAAQRAGDDDLLLVAPR